MNTHTTSARRITLADHFNTRLSFTGSFHSYNYFPARVAFFEIPHRLRGLAQLVSPADDGPMPQTREHLCVLRALGVDEGVVAITKADAADAAALRGELVELVPGAEIVACPARTRAGLGELRHALRRVASRARSRAPLPGPARPPLHRPL